MPPPLCTQTISLDYTPPTTNLYTKPTVAFSTDKQVAAARVAFAERAYEKELLVEEAEVRPRPSTCTQPLDTAFLLYPVLIDPLKPLPNLFFNTRTARFP